MRFEFPTLRGLSGTLDEKDAEHALASALPGSMSGPLGFGGSVSNTDAAHKIVSILYKKGWVVTDTAGNTPASAQADIKDAVLSSLGAALAGNNKDALAKAFKGLVGKYSIVKQSDTGAKGAKGASGDAGSSGAAGDSGSSSSPLIDSADLKKWMPLGLVVVAGAGLIFLLRGK